MTGSIHHVGVAVDDLDEAIVRWTALFGAMLEHRERVDDQGVEAASLRLKADGVELIDETPRRGMFGLQVAFVHPEATGGVLAEFVGNE